MADRGEGSLSDISEVGVAAVRIIPVAKDFTKDLTRQIGDDLAKAAKKAGDDAGDELSKGIANGVDGGSGKLETAATKIGDIFKTALAAAGVAAAALLAKGMETALEQEQLGARFEASMGGGEFAARMGQIAGDLYLDGFGDSIADTGDVVQRVWRSGLLPEDATDEQISRLSTKILTFADVMAQDMDMTTQAVSNMIRTGLADSSEEALDILTQGIQQGADRAGDLLEVFQEYSVEFEALGISAEDATGLMTQGLRNGARDADTVADALKEIAIRAKAVSEGNVEAARGFELLGLNADDMAAKFAAGGDSAREGLDQVLDGLNAIEDPILRNEAATALFGTKAEDLQGALMGLDLDTAAAHLGDYEGATDDLGAAYDNLSDKINVFKRRALDKLAKFVTRVVIPVFERVADVVGPPLQAVFGAVRDAIDSINWDRVAFVWQTFVDAITGTDTGFEFAGWVGTIQDIGTALHDAYTDGVKPFFDALADVDWEGVWSDLQPAIDTATGLIEDAGALVARVIGDIADVLDDVDWAAVWADAEPILTQVGEILGAAFELVATAISQLIEDVSAALDWLEEFWADHGDTISEYASIAWDMISSIISGTLDVILGVIRLVTALMEGDWSGAWDAMKQIVSGGLQNIWAVISAAWNGIALLTRTINEAIEAKLRQIWSEIVATVREKGQGVVDWFRGLPSLITSALAGLAGVILAPFRNALSSVTSLWSKTIGGLRLPSVGSIVSRALPKFHGGGVYTAPPGQTEGPAILRHGETVFTRDQLAAIGSAQRAGATPAARLTLDVTGADRDLVRVVQKWVRVNAGGDAQLGLGTRRRTA